MHIKSKNSWFKHYDFILLDIVTIVISFIIANLIYLGRLNYYRSTIYTSVLLCIVIPIILIDLLYNPFSGILRRNTTTEIVKALQYVIYDFVVAILLMYVLKLGALFSRVVFVSTYIIYFVLIIIVRVFWKKMLIEGKIRVLPDSNSSLLIIVSRKDVERILENINTEEYQQYDIKGLCIVDEDLSGKKIDNYPVLCNKKDIYDCVVDNNIGEVFICTKPNVISNKTIEKLMESGVGIHFNIGSILGIESDDQHIDKVGIYKTLGIGLYTFTPKQLFYLSIKRIMDIIFSIVTMPFVLLIILMFKIAYVISGDSYPILYKQKRVGLHGKLFDLYKLRTMVPDAEEQLEILLKDKKLKKEWDKYHKLENDPRITKVGKILRRTSLDELPQFINVLKGDMSIIGPRPLVEGELQFHNGLRLYEKVKPGITGWWACNGRSNISYDERLDLEYYYVKNCSFSLDILIFLRSIYIVLKRTGAE